VGLVVVRVVRVVVVVVVIVLGRGMMILEGAMRENPTAAGSDYNYSYDYGCYGAATREQGECGWVTEVCVLCFGGKGNSGSDSGMWWWCGGGVVGWWVVDGGWCLRMPVLGM
jgi:hypothetical protein